MNLCYKFANLRGWECLCKFDGNSILSSVLRSFARTSGLVHILSYLVGIYSVPRLSLVRIG